MPPARLPQRRHMRECERPSGAASISVGAIPIVKQDGGAMRPWDGTHPGHRLTVNAARATCMRVAGRGGARTVRGRVSPGDAFRHGAGTTHTVHPAPSDGRRSPLLPHPPPSQFEHLKPRPFCSLLLFVYIYIHARCPTFPSCHATQIESKAPAARQCRSQLHVGCKTAQVTTTQGMEALLLWVLCSRARSESHAFEAGLVGHR